MGPSMSGAPGCLQGDAEDTAGMRGIHLQRNVVAVAQKALTANLRLLGPLVLPLSELVTPSLPSLMHLQLN